MGGLSMKVPGVFYHAKSFKEVPSGAVILEDGASGTEMFGIMEGEVEVRLPKRDCCRGDRYQASGDKPEHVPLPCPRDTDVRAAGDVHYRRAPSR